MFVGSRGRILWVEQGALQARGRRAPLAAAESLERVKAAADPTPALRHPATQHCAARDVRRAQARLLVVETDERPGAAHHAAHGRAPATYSAVPLNQGQLIAGAQRHAACALAHNVIFLAAGCLSLGERHGAQRGLLRSVTSDTAQGRRPRPPCPGDQLHSQAWQYCKRQACMAYLHVGRRQWRRTARRCRAACCQRRRRPNQACQPRHRPSSGSASAPLLRRRCRACARRAATRALPHAQGGPARLPRRR